MNRLGGLPQRRPSLSLPDDRFGRGAAADGACKNRVMRAPDFNLRPFAENVGNGRIRVRPALRIYSGAHLTA